MQKEAKKITIFIGCWIHQFVKEIRFFDALEKKLHCKVKKRSSSTYSTKINNTAITFQFCFGPHDDAIWRERKKIYAKEGLRLPPSIHHLASKKIDAAEIYYVGFCGIFKGKKHETYLPNAFVKVLFKEYILRPDDLDTMKLFKKIDYPNTLIGKIKGKKCTTLTSNQVFSLNYVQDHSDMLLKKLSKKLQKHADVVEMENYEIIKHFGKKYPIGIFLYGTDIPANKRHAIQRTTLNLNWERFNRKTLEMIKKVIV